MSGYTDELLDRAEHAEAKCQELQEKLDDALLKLEKIAKVLAPTYDCCPDSYA